MLIDSISDNPATTMSEFIFSNYSQGFALIPNAPLVVVQPTGMCFWDTRLAVVR